MKCEEETVSEDTAVYDKNQDYNMKCEAEEVSKGTAIYDKNQDYKMKCEAEEVSKDNAEHDENQENNIMCEAKTICFNQTDETKTKTICEPTDSVSENDSSDIRDVNIVETEEHNGYLDQVQTEVFIDKAEIVLQNKLEKNKDMPSVTKDDQHTDKSEIHKQKDPDSSTFFKENELIINSEDKNNLFSPVEIFDDIDYDLLEVEIETD